VRTSLTYGGPFVPAGKINVIGAEAPCQRCIHGVRAGEAAEQEETAFAEAGTRVIQDRDDPLDIRLEGGRRSAAREAESRSIGMSLRSVANPEFIAAEMLRAAACASSSCSHRRYSGWRSAIYSRMERLSQTTPCFVLSAGTFPEGCGPGSSPCCPSA
jgi:hypothetical protein